MVRIPGCSLLFGKKSHPGEVLGFRTDWFLCEPRGFLSPWYLFLGIAFPVFLVSISRVLIQGTQIPFNPSLLTALSGYSGFAYKIGVSCLILKKKNREIFVLYTFSAYQFCKSEAGVGNWWGILVSRIVVPSQELFHLSINAVLYCHLWLLPFGLAEEHRVNKWITIPLFLQTLHHFMNVQESQGECPLYNISFSWWQKKILQCSYKLLLGMKPVSLI